MKNWKFKIINLSILPLSFLPLLTLACNSNNIKNEDNNKEDDEEKENNKPVADPLFTQKVVDENWNNINVDANTLDEWWTIRKLYEDKITELNQENIEIELENEENINIYIKEYEYYKNLFYINWYLWIIAIANQNISWLTFYDRYGDILENDDKDTNFKFVLYVKHETRDGGPGEYFYFKDLIRVIINYSENNTWLGGYYGIPKNYLNFNRTKIEYDELRKYYRRLIKPEDEAKIEKVITFFIEKRQKMKYQKKIDNNHSKFLERLRNRHWGGQLNTNIFAQWLYNKRGSTFEPIYDYLQPRWEEWIKNFN